MIRPVYAQTYEPLRNNRMKARLIHASQWWVAVLKKRICQSRRFDEVIETVDIFTDAASDPPTLAAILIAKDKVMYTVDNVDDAVLKAMVTRCADCCCAPSMCCTMSSCAGGTSKSWLWRFWRRI